MLATCQYFALSGQPQPMDQPVQLAGHLSWTPPEVENIFHQIFSMHDAIADISHYH